MTTKSWTGNAGDGKFLTSGNWTGGTPTTGQNVVITKSNANVAYAGGSSSSTLALGSLTLGSTDYLDIQSGDLAFKTGITDSGTLGVDVATLEVGGTINLNTGSKFLINGIPNYSSYLFIDSNTKLMGAGTFIIASSADAVIGQIGGNVPVFENVNSTIQGAGGFALLQFQNDAGATVEANGGASYKDSMVFNTGYIITNAGLMEAVTGGSIVFDDGSYVSQYDSNGTSKGVLSADGNGSYVEFDGACTVSGGELKTSNGGVLQIDSGSHATFDNVAIDGTLLVPDATSALLEDFVSVGGTITDMNTIAIAGQTTVVAGGTISLVDDGDGTPRIVSSGGVGELENRGLVHGDGTIGDGTLTFDNFGTIRADTGTLSLTLAATADGASFNELGGTLEADAGSELDIGTGDQNGSTFDNLGTVHADGGTIVFGWGVDMSTSDYNGNQLGAGTYIAEGNGATISLNESFSSLAAEISLDGAGSVVEVNDQSGSGNHSLESLLTDIAAGGELLVTEGRDYTTTNALTIEGTLIVGNDTLAAKSITASAASTISGFGTIAAPITDSGAIVVEDGLTLTFTKGSSFLGTMSGGGTLAFGAGSYTIGSGARITPAGWALNGSTTKLSASLTYAGAFSEANGNLAFATGGKTLTLTGASTFNGGGVTGGDTIAIAGAATMTNFTAANSATLALTDGPGTSGSLALSGTLTLGGVNSFGAATIGKLNIVNYDDTLTLADGAAIIVGSGGTGSITNGGTIQKIAGTGTATIGASLIDNLFVNAASGTLAITGALTGTGQVNATGGGQVMLGAGTGVVTSGVLTSKNSFSAAANSTVTFAAPFSSLKAALTLNGAGSVIQATSGGTTTSLESMLTDIGVGGNLTVTGGRAYTTGNAISLEGGLRVGPIGGGTFTSGTITGAASSFMGGSGTIASNLTTAGGVSLGGTLIFTGTDTFAGAIFGLGTFALSNNTATFNKGASFSNLNGGLGSIVSLTNATMNIATSLTDPGYFNETSSTVAFTASTATALTVGKGATLAGGSETGLGTLKLGGSSTSSGYAVAGGATLEVDGSLDLTGTLTLGSTSGGVATRGSLRVAAGGTLTLDNGGAVGLATGGLGSIVNSGTIVATDDGDHFEKIGLGINNSGTIKVTGYDSSLEIAGAVTGSGTITDASYLTFDASVASTQAVTMGAGLDLESARTFGASISGFDSGDRIAVDHFGTGTTLSYNATTDVLTLTKGSTVANLQLVGTYSASRFTLDNEGAYSDIYYAPPPAAAAAHAPPASQSLGAALFDAAFSGASPDMTTMAARQSSSLHQMIQAMATMTPSASSTITSSAPTQMTEMHLAAAHA